MVKTIVKTIVKGDKFEGSACDAFLKMEEHGGFACTAPIMVAVEIHRMGHCGHDEIATLLRRPKRLLTHLEHCSCHDVEKDNLVLGQE